MLRFLLSVLAVVLVVLAYLQEMQELWVAAIVLTTVVLVMWSVHSWRHYRSSRRPSLSGVPAPLDDEPDLQALGILDIRPRNSDSASSNVPRGSEDAPDTDGNRLKSSDTSGETSDGARLREFVTANHALGARRHTAQPTIPTIKPPNEAVLGPLLEAVRAALDAHTTCLLQQSADTSECHVVAIAGEDRARQAGESFVSKQPLVSPSDTAQSITLRSVDGTDLESRGLGYSRTPGSVQQIAVAPVGGPELYLVADTTKEFGLSDPRASTLLAEFARMIRLLLGNYDPVKSKPRPRRDIIQEEIDDAREHSTKMALAIVYLNRGEEVLAAGEAAVQEAEMRQRALLEQTQIPSRVVRFGPCMFGVFIYGGISEIEAWDEEVQDMLHTVGGLLEGGVSIGIAIFGSRHETPDDLRNDAKKALGEAYSTGSSVVSP